MPAFSDQFIDRPLGRVALVIGGGFPAPSIDFADYEKEIVVLVLRPDVVAGSTGQRNMII
jgi:hypothetical protein